MGALGRNYLSCIATGIYGSCLGSAIRLPGLVSELLDQSVAAFLPKIKIRCFFQ